MFVEALLSCIMMFSTHLTPPRRADQASMAYRGLRTRILGVVVGAATVEGMSLVGRSSCLRMVSTSSSLRMMAAGPVVDADRYAEFIKDKVRMLVVSLLFPFPISWGARCLAGVQSL